MDAELNAHLEFRVARLVARGMSPEEAAREARNRFGEFDHASALLKQSALQRERHMHWREWSDALQQDVRLTFRTLRRAPAFASAVVLTLALGIGANAAMFGIVDRLLLRAPSGISEPDRIVQLSTHTRRDDGDHDQWSYPYRTYMAIREGVSKASIVATVTFPDAVPIGRGANAELVKEVQASASFFAMVGARPALGRFFSADDDREPVGQPVAVISYGLWKRRFGGENSAIGQKIEVGNRPFTVIGVAPRGFTGIELESVDVWLPVTSASGLRFMPDSIWMSTRNGTWLRIFALLKPDASPQQLAAEVTPINDAEGEIRWHGTNAQAAATPLLESLRGKRGPVATVAKLLGGLSIIVVLIACTNVVNMTLSRAATRKQEFAIRLALGVSRRRLAVQLLTESLILALLGGACALGIAWIGGSLARTLIFGDTQFADLPVDGRLIAYIAVLSCSTAIVTAFVPLLQTRALTLTATLRSGAREGKRTGDRTRAAILVGQAALSVLLLVATGLFARSLREVNSIQTGFEANRLIFGRMNFGFTNETAERRDELFRDMAVRLRGMSAIQSASVAATIAGNSSTGTGLYVPGMDSVPHPKNNRTTYLNAVEPAFFATTGIRILDGRNFTLSDDATAAPVAIINETMARTIWPKQSAIGRCIQLKKDDACTTIVGVAQNSHRQDWIEDEIFLITQPLGQSRMKSRVLLVRPRGDVDGRSITLVRQAMQAASTDLPYAEVMPMSRLYDVELRPWRMGAGMLAAFATLALFLVAVGLFATLSFAVSQRTHEIGVRMALGARAGQVIRLIMRQGLMLAAIGSAIGGAIALASGRFVQDMLYQTSPRDASVFGAAIFVIALVALAATALPAFRASRINPIRALRAD